MKTEQLTWDKQSGWQTIRANDGVKPQLVLAFGSRSVIGTSDRYKEIHDRYESAHTILCSTSGEICDSAVSDDTISLVAIEFGEARVETLTQNIASADDSFSVGSQIVADLPKDDLVHVMVFSDGLNVNGTNLVRGISQGLPENVKVTGGLVGDGPLFEKTLVGLDSVPESNKVVLVGFYGKKLQVGYGSFGGWDAFGPERLITKSEGSTLYELDGRPALEWYKEYLGPYASDLPSSGLLFPMSLHLEGADGKDVEIVRTLLSVDEKAQSLTFAGDMPEGEHIRLMKANFDHLINAAGSAAKLSVDTHGASAPDLAILISCVGRKLVLKERASNEIDAVRSALGDHTTITGFYSYGEICPNTPIESVCRLHNQTMTITTFSEA